MVTNIYTTFENRVELHGDREFINMSDASYTYRKMADMAETFAGGFAKAGLGPGDHLGVLLNNGPEFVGALLGAARQGITVACLNTSFQGESLEHLLTSADVAALLSTDELLSNDVDACEDAAVESIYSLSAESDWTGLPDAPIPEPASVNARATAALLHTSGTTGLPKWCELSHAYFVRLGDRVADHFEMTGVDTVFNPLPLYHINPLGDYLCGGLSAGATLAMVSTFSVSKFWEQVRRLEATVLILHMAPKDMLLKRTTAEEASGHGVRVMFPADKEFMRRFDVPKVVAGYGSTEAGGLTHFNKFTHPPELPPGEKLSQYVGYPRRDVEVRLVDEGINRVPRGERGEILVRPDEPGIIFDGYYSAPESTRSAWDELWYNTGDTGYIDEAGALHFIQRKTNSVTHKGEFVNVDLVESLLENHPTVESAFVVGESDHVVGDRVKACILTDGDLDPMSLLERVETDIPGYMVPEFVDRINDVPRIEGTEKVDREALRRRDRERAWRRPDAVE